MATIWKDDRSLDKVIDPKAPPISLDRVSSSHHPTSDPHASPSTYDVGIIGSDELVDLIERASGADCQLGFIFVKRDLVEAQQRYLYASCRTEVGIGRVSTALDLQYDSSSHGKPNNCELQLRGWTLTANFTVVYFFMTFIFKVHDR